MDSLIFFLKSLIIGIVEGVTEFLPISSTGHIIITKEILKFSNYNKDYFDMYAYVIQLGAILAVIVLYYNKLKSTLINFFPSKVEYKYSGFYFWSMIVLSCIPGGIAVILVDDIAEKYLSNPISVCITLFIGGFLIIFAEKKFRNNNTMVSKDFFVTPKQALTIGLIQCLSIIPGMSRSASTIIGGY